MQATFISHSPEETQALGRTWADKADEGWVIGLSGDLGTGKTQLVKGIAAGLGFSGKVQSPTFALINEYSGGRLPLFHLDLYRLESQAEIVRAGLEEYLVNPSGVAVIEWIERWTGEDTVALSQGTTKLRLVKFEQISETDRRISYEDFGA